MLENIIHDGVAEGRLIASILEAAILDAKKEPTVTGLVCRQARSFISLSNKTFAHYCFLINIDPVWLHEKIWEMLNSNHRINCKRIIRLSHKRKTK